MDLKFSRASALDSVTLLGRTRGFSHCQRLLASNATPRGSEVEEGVTSTSESRQSSAGPPRMKLQKVEKLGPESWSGVAAIDKESKAKDVTIGKTLALVGGDLLALSLFAAIGRASHGKSLDLPSVLSTAAPFLIGWFGAADLQKAFGREAQGGNPTAAAKKAAIVWASGIPVGILVRSAQQGHLPNPGFVIVSLVTTFVSLVGWRTALAAATPAAGQESQKATNKRGSPFEFIRLLASLTTRW